MNDSFLNLFDFFHSVSILYEKFFKGKFASNSPSNISCRCMLDHYFCQPPVELLDVVQRHQVIRASQPADSEQEGEESISSFQSDVLF